MTNNIVAYGKLKKTRASMISRCTDPANPDYKSYGARGIKVCDRWLASFENFFDDMGYKPDRSYSIERIDNDKGYSPDNCIWADKKTQARNRRNNRVVTVAGKSQCIAAWADELGVHQSIIHNRINKHGWCDERAVSTPFDVVEYTHNGESRTLVSWAEILNIGYDTLYSRINELGWDVSKALSTPVKEKVLYRFNNAEKTLFDWADEFGLSRETVYGRIHTAGWSIEDALTIEPPKTNGPITFDGRTQSATAWAKEVGLSRRTISNRIKAGWAVDAALFTPPLTRKSVKSHSS